MRAIPVKTLIMVFILLSLAVEGMGAGIATLAVSATVLTKNTCRFTTTTGTLAFGNIDPSGTADVTASTTLTFRCNGTDPFAFFYIEDRDKNNNNQMVDASANVLPYQLSYTPFTSPPLGIPRNTPQTLTITGTIKSSDYRVAAISDSYSDMVTIDIVP